MKVNRYVPNILCMFRILMIPFILLFLLDNGFSLQFSVGVRILISGALFGLAMLSDLLDGKIARRYDLVSNLGKFLDPIADKMLVLSVLCAFLGNGIISVVPVVIILTREFCVTTLRLMAASQGDVLSAKTLGKVKTLLQGCLIGAVFIYLAVSHGLMDLSTPNRDQTWNSFSKGRKSCYLSRVVAICVPSP